jgi:serine-type D-Ala-D-Ala carboxypeptidase/endopeptidase (penicillin-binding protein 4)
MRGPLNPPKGDFHEQQKVIMKIPAKIFLIIIYLFVFSSILFPQNNDQHLLSSIQYQESGIRDLASGINKIINDPFFQKTLIAIDVFDLSDSISLFNKNEKLLLRPASNMKLLTSAAALFNLGEHYSFRTDIYYTGVIDDETLYGDIFVVGGFDPDFTSKDLDSLVSIVKSLGIKNIAGGIYADVSNKDSMYWGKGWMWDDDPEPTAPYLSSLNINDNSIEVFIEGGKIDSPAVVTLIPKTNFVAVENNSVTVSASDTDNFIITRDWVNRKNNILVNGKVRKVSIVDSSEHISKVNLLYPEKYFLTLFKERLEQDNIYVDKPINIKRLEENAIYLCTIYRSIDTVLSQLNKNSDNLNGEMLIYAMACNDSGDPATADNGLRAVRRFIDTLGFSSTDYSIADGSGVSHYNLISAELLIGLLKYMYYGKKELFDLFYYSLAIAGVDGTIRNRMRNTLAESKVRAKSGTLNGVSNLSGYVTAKNGHLIAFSIMIQNFVEDYSKARSFQNKICELLAEFE